MLCGAAQLVPAVAAEAPSDGAGATTPGVEGDLPNGIFESYNREERTLLQAAQRRPLLRAAGTVLVDGRGSQVINLVRARVRATIAVAGQYDASLDLTQDTNVRAPTGREAAAVDGPASLEVDRHLTKQSCLLPTSPTTWTPAR